MTPDQLLTALALLQALLALFIIVVGLVIFTTVWVWLFSDESRGSAAIALAMFLLGMSIIPAIRMSVSIGDELDGLRNPPTEEASP